jgi:hypothetical protein
VSRGQKGKPRSCFYQPLRQHVRNVARSGRISGKQLSQILHFQIQPDRQREKVDHLIRIWPKNMGAENATRASIGS